MEERQAFELFGREGKCLLRLAELDWFNDVGVLPVTAQDRIGAIGRHQQQLVIDPAPRRILAIPGLAEEIDANPRWRDQRHVDIKEAVLWGRAGVPKLA